MNPLDEWFIAAVLPHEAALMRYLHRVWRNHAEVPDLRQEIYVRIYQSAAKTKPQAPKSFLFATARNLLADKARRERVISIDYTQDLDALDVLIDEISPEHRYGARQELRRLSEAFDGLSDKYRAAIWLCRVEGLSQHEAAQRLGINEGTLESHLCRGLKMLARAIFSEEFASAAPDGAQLQPSEHVYEQRSE
jgi:RNA polymerase sigma-70 factor (ECF subfamily)